MCRHSSVGNSNSQIVVFGKHRYRYVRWEVGPQLCALHVGGTKECLSFLCTVYTTGSFHTALFTRRISFSFPRRHRGSGAAWGWGRAG